MTRSEPKNRLRWIQKGIRLGVWLLFLALLLSGTGPEPADFSDFFLRLDPLSALALPLATRGLSAWLWPGLTILALTFLFGRFFCGWLCPFGLTLDGARALGRFLAGPKAAHLNPGLNFPLGRRWKYLFLALIFGAALAGVNILFWGTPSALVTRLYVTLALPLAGQPTLTLLQALNITAPAQAAVTRAAFDGLYFLVIFFGLLFLLELIRPRAWCRFFCPAGALLALCARKSLWRRRLTNCSACGRCVQNCPTGAAALPPDQASSECLSCRRCRTACPKGAIRFTPASRQAAEPEISATAPPQPSRRSFLLTAAGGLGLAGIQLGGAGSLLARGGTHTLIRPPGARPEHDFLAACIRCGQCFRACPTNGLQPAGVLQGGLEGVFSPILTARRGPCEPHCRACGQVCPTDALRTLPLEEKLWAKIGTAVIRPERCLALAEGRSCVVCQEVCPYGAVKLKPVPGRPVTGPVVDAAACYGCGYCEKHCPPALPAIMVEPLGALRLNQGAYQTAARAAGLHLELGGVPEPQDGSALPPGFTP